MRSNSEPTPQQVRDAISRGRLDTAIELLKTAFNGSQHLTEVIAQSARYHQLRKDKVNRFLTSEEISREYAAMVNQLLALVDTMPIKVIPKEEIAADADFESTFEYAQASVQLSRLFLAELPEPFTITDMEQHLRGPIKRKTIKALLDQWSAHQLIRKSKQHKKTHWSLTEEGKRFFTRWDAQPS